MSALALSAATKLTQSMTLGQRQLQGLALLTKSLPEMRAELAAELAANPAIEDFDHPLETPLSEVEAKRREDDVPSDYPEDDYVPAVNRDEEAAERRQAFFDNQVGTETLQQHLVAQFPLSDIPKEDWVLAEMLVGDLDANGRYRGSIPDVQMSFAKSASEVEELLRKIMALDPPGCGARNPRECLLAQLDKLDGSPHQETVRRLISDHFEDVANNRLSRISSSLGLTHAEYAEALKALRTLDAYPGRVFPSEADRPEFINPEVHAVRIDGRWMAMTDRRSLPKIKLSNTFLERMKASSLSEEDRARFQAYVDRARTLGELVRERRDTLEAVAQAIFDRQPDFFEKGLPGLVPMTELSVAEDVGLTGPTISRVVCGKYASTPFGTVELRRFFTTGVKTVSGEVLSQEAALEALKGVIAAEDASNPLSDQGLVEKMTAAGYPLARRTIAKYRDLLGIPSAIARRRR